MSMLQQIIEEQKARVQSGELHPRNFSEAVRNAIVAQKRDEILFKTGLSDRPGRNWEMMEKGLARLREQDSTGPGEVASAAWRDIGQISKGVGHLLWRGVTAPARPIQTAKFLTSDWGRVTDPNAWKRAWERTTAPGKYHEATGAPPESLAGTLQDVLAQTARGYKDLATDPVGRAAAEPVFTALDLLPLWGGAVGAGSRLAKAAAASKGLSQFSKAKGLLKAGRAIEKVAPGKVAGTATRGLIHKMEGAKRPLIRRAGEELGTLERAFDDWRKYREIDARNLAEFYGGRRRDEVWSRTHTRPMQEMLDEGAAGPGNLMAILEGRASPAGLSKEQARRLAAYKLRRKRRYGRHSTRPIEESLGRKLNPEQRAYAPFVKAMTAKRTVRTPAGELIQARPFRKKTPKEELTARARASMGPKVEEQHLVRELGRQVKAEGGQPKYVAGQSLGGKPFRRGEHIHYTPEEAQYVPHFAELQGLKPSSYMPVSPTASGQVSKPFSRQWKGRGMEDIPMMKNVEEIDVRHLSEVRRAVQNEQAIRYVTDNFQQPVKLPDGTMIHQATRDQLLGGQIKSKGKVVFAGGRDALRRALDEQGLVEWSPGPFLRFYQAQLSLNERVLGALKKKGVDKVSIEEVKNTLVKQLEPGSLEDMIKYVGVRKNDKFTFVPKQVADNLNKQIVASNPHWKLFFDKPMNVWRPLVLGTPRWVVNNFIGNIFLNTLRGVGVKSYARAMRSFWNDYRREHGKSANMRWLDLAPEQVRRGFAEYELQQAEARIGDLGLKPLPKKIYGAGKAVVEAPVIGHGVQALKKGWFENVQKVNTIVEDIFRRANYFRGAFPEAKRRMATGARKETIGRAVKGLAETGDLLDEVRRLTAEVTPYDPVVKGLRPGKEVWNTPAAERLIGKVNEFLFDYSKMDRWERRVMRTIFPFYSWYKNILGLLVKLPAKYPGRARAMTGLGQMAEEMSSDTAERDMPEYMRSAVRGKDSRGPDPLTGEMADLTTFWGTRGMNPVATLGEARSWQNMLNPFLRAGIETASSRDLLTGRPLERAGQTRDILTGKYWKIGKSGELEEMPKAGGLKMFTSRMANQTPLLRIALDSLAQGQRYGDSFMEVRPGSKKSADKWRGVLRLAGFPYTKVDLERMAKSTGEERKRTVSRIWKEEMKRRPEDLRRAMMVY